MNNQDHYKILGIASDATLEEIKRSYRRKAKTYHTDVNNSTWIGLSLAKARDFSF